MYLYMAYSEVLSTGRYCILNGDLVEIYVPAIRQIVYNILHGESIYYSFSNSLGMNLSAYNAAYATGSIFNLLYLIFYKVDPAIITGAIIVLKTGLIGSSFFYFYKTIYKDISIRVVAFSIFYSMCSFNVFMNQTNIIWMDALYIMPYLLCELVRFVKYKKYYRLLAAYAYLFIYNFYMGYIVGIISFMFLLCFTINYYLKHRIYIGMFLLKYFCVVMWAIFIASVVWMPAAIFLIQHRAEDTTSLVWSGCNLIDVYNQLFVGQYSGMEARYPYIYCGIPTMLLIPFYFANKKIPRNEKIVYGILISMLLICCVTPGGYLFIHALDAPDGWGFRFSFAISFVFCVISCRIAARLDQLNKNALIIACIINGIMYIVAMQIQLNKPYPWIYTSNTWTYTIVNTGIILLWLGYFMLTRRKTNNKDTMRGIIALGVLLTLAECIYNGYLSYYKEERFYPSVMEDYYFAWRGNITNALAEIKSEDEDNNFYRIRTYDDWLYNTDTYMNYAGISDFSTTENDKTRKSLEKLGLYSSPRIMLSYGLTPVTKMLLDVKYEIGVIDLYAPMRVKDENTISKNEYCLNIGYIVDEDISNYTYSSGDVFQNSNELLSVMTGSDIEVYSREDNVSIEEKGIHLRKGLNQLVLEGDSEKDEMIITYRIPNDVRPAYSQFYYGDSQMIAGMPFFYYGVENDIMDDGHFGVSYIKTMDQDENGYYVMIGMYHDGIQAVYYEEANFYYYNEDALRNAFDILSKQQLKVEEFHNTKIKGNVELLDDQGLLFLSIPYDEGWKVYVDGVPAETIPVLDNGFMAVAIERMGIHNVELKYEVPGLKVGALISIISSFVYIGLLIKNKHHNKQTS